MGKVGLLWRAAKEFYFAGELTIVPKRGDQAVTGSPWELALVLFLSAAVFLSIWHFVAQFLTWWTKVASMTSIDHQIGREQSGSSGIAASQSFTRTLPLARFILRPPVAPAEIGPRAVKWLAAAGGLCAHPYKEECSQRPPRRNVISVDETGPFV
jgi:hypothetical protein